MDLLAEHRLETGVQHHLPRNRYDLQQPHQHRTSLSDPGISKRYMRRGDFRISKASSVCAYIQHNPRLSCLRPDYFYSLLMTHPAITDLILLKV